MNEGDEERLGRLRDEIGSQHKTLLAALRGLEAMLETSPPAQGDLARRLNAVADILEDHIAGEEAGDLFKWLPIARSSRKGEIEALRQEHPGMVAAFRQLANETRGAPSVGIETELAVGVRSAIAKVREHEARESAVVLAQNDHGN